MCGIFGWLREDGLPDYEIGRRITDLLKHRGPDDSGYKIVNNCFLGHRRLSIIDVSKAGHQPFSSADGRYNIVFNGEIYNYLELRNELIAEGISFSTQTDTEVLLHAYLRWGKECLNKLEGMFAFAIFDRNAQELFLCRDHLGQKPLYFTQQNGNFIFSSELRCIIKHPQVDPRIELKSILKYHVYDFLPRNLTPLRNVWKLPPGHFLVLRNNSIVIHEYWKSTPGHNESKITIDKAISQLDSLLFDSVKKHLRSDVPYGIFLSGGIDSSLVTHYARSVLGKDDLKTFSVAFEYKNFDESKVAQAVARKYGTNHTVIPMTKESILNSIHKILDHLDEPLANPGLVNSYFISNFAAGDIKVALSGNGGDELFGGYVTFKADLASKILSALPDQFINSFKFLSSKVLSASSDYMSFDFKVNNLLKGFPGPDILRNQCWLAAISPEEIPGLYKGLNLPDLFFKRATIKDNIFEEVTDAAYPVEKSNLRNKMLIQYQKLFLPEFVCANTDRASMSVSLEVRSPFIHRPIIEFANTLPQNLKIRKNKLKYLLFELGKRLGLPREVLNHPKQGFTFPVAGWLRTDLKETMEEVFSQETVSRFGIIDKNRISLLKREHLSGKRNHYKALWNLLTLFKWMQNFPEVYV
jgi:asparagine synthase (glutamine-hydrolysing)